MCTLQYPFEMEIVQKVDLLTHFCVPSSPRLGNIAPRVRIEIDISKMFTGMQKRAKDEVESM